MLETFAISLAALIVAAAVIETVFCLWFIKQIVDAAS